MGPGPSSLFTAALLLPLLTGTFAESLSPQTLNCITSIPGLKTPGLITLPAEANYTALATPFNERLTAARMPGVIVLPTSPAQISSVLHCASLTNPPSSVTARSGGHSYAAYALSGDIVIDMRNFKDITLNSTDYTVRVETGNRLGDVATAIFDDGGRALPHGSCPYVGVGGHTLYGGFGWLGRFGGLLVDTTVAAEVILANGTFKRVTATSGDDDLWWAIRGGGPSFALVVAWTYQTVAAPNITTRYTISYNGTGAPNVPSAVASKAYSAWEAFAGQESGQPELLAMSVDFGAGSAQGEVTLSFGGNWYGNGGSAEARGVLGGLLEGLGSAWVIEMHEVGWIEGLIELAGKTTLDTSAPDVPDNFFAKSLVTTEPSAVDAVEKFVGYLATQGQTSDTAWFVQVDLYGAKSRISRTGRDFNAFAHRDAFVVWQFYASKDMNASGYPADGIGFVDGMVDELTTRPEGAYPNYIDPTLVDWRELYFGSHTARLAAVKRSVDRTEVYRLAQGTDTAQPVNSPDVSLLSLSQPCKLSPRPPFLRPSTHSVQPQNAPERPSTASLAEPRSSSATANAHVRPASSEVIPTPPPDHPAHRPAGTAHLCYQGDPRGPDSADHRHPDDPTPSSSAPRPIFTYLISPYALPPPIHSPTGVDLRKELGKIRSSLSLIESIFNRNAAYLLPPLDNDRPFKQESDEHALASNTDFAPAMLARPRTGHGGMYAGPTSAATHFATVKTESDVTDEDDDDDRSIVSEPPGSPSLRDDDLLSYLPSDPNVVEGLITHYFETCQWENRYLHHASFTHAWARFRANLNPDRLTLATVFVVLAIAVQFLPARHPLLESFNESAVDLSENYYAFGCNALTRYHAERRTYSLELIELLLLRTHYLTITKDQCEDLWSIRGEIVSTAIAMGLHRDPGRWKITRELAERRRWAWWNIMLIERWQAFMFGRPLSICNHHFDTQFPGAFDPAYDPSGRLHLPYLHLFRLAEAMGDIMDDAVSVRPVPYERVIGQDQVLARWLDTLPAELNLDDYRLARALSSKELATRRTGAQSLCLRIFYYHVRFTLHRPYSGPWKATPVSQTIMERPPDPRWEQSLGTAISAADKLTHLVTQARPDFLANDWLAVPGHLHWGPFHAFSAAMFFSFQLIANPKQAGGNLFRANIQRVMNVLEHLRGIHVADKAFSVLEALAPLYDESAAGVGGVDGEEQEHMKNRVLGFVRRLAFPCHDSPAFTKTRVHGGVTVVNGAVVHHGAAHLVGGSSVGGGSGHGASPASHGSMSSPGTQGMPVTPVVGSVVLPVPGQGSAGYVQGQGAGGGPPPPPQQSQQQQQISAAPRPGLYEPHQTQHPQSQSQSHPQSQSQSHHPHTQSPPQPQHTHHPNQPPPQHPHQPPPPHGHHPHPHPQSHPHPHPHPHPHVPGGYADETVWGTSIGLDSTEWASFVSVVQPRVPPPVPPLPHPGGLQMQMHATHLGQG
ncbi:Glucooligosaccharide oxidase [Sphaerobolus stellatus SS14]|uniref:Glucooligosaccharide oxidase n=1 Tax=Sphaerobolus stellatus (strain SS14) TaxID=990650 RepID=A0A0C9UKP7_SPHS4|nr:Glucooligosaccharide oxidase [Sphaerobolus stellatus SS14]